MKIHSDRRHSFPVPPDELWEAMARVDAYREWWPWLRHFEAAPLVPGALWTATVQPPLPYRLQFDVQLGDVVAPRHVSAEISGDITGSARLEVRPSGDGSELHLVSELAPANAVLRGVAHLARPMVRYGHEWVLDTGLRQFRDRALP